MNVRTKSWLIALAFTAYVIFSWVYYPSLIATLSSSNLVTSIVIYLITNPAYVLLIYYIIRFNTKNKVKATLASILLILSLDMVASPRVMVEEILATGTSASINLGTIIIKSIMSFGIPAKIAWYLYYLVLPVAFFVMAMELMGYVDFIKKIKNGGI